MNFLQEINIALQNTTIFGVFFFIIGACIGSFFNVVAFRTEKIMDSENANLIKGWLEEKGIEVPNKINEFITNMSLSFPLSHCYSCKNRLKWYHNIPVLSYFLLGGKCGFCKTPYSIQYPIVEFIGGLLMLGSYLYFFPKYGLEVFVLASIFFMITYVLILIDIKSMLLPDGLNYVLMWIGILASLFGFYMIKDMSIKQSILGATIGYMILWVMATAGRKLKGQEVMGGGDLKLVAAIGAFMGVPGVIFTIFASPFIGIFSWIYIKLSKAENPQFPYGPALILTSWIYLFYGKEIFQYLNLPI